MHIKFDEFLFLTFQVETLVPVTTFVPKFDPSVHTPKEPSADPVEPPMPYKSTNALR